MDQYNESINSTLENPPPPVQNTVITNNAYQQPRPNYQYQPPQFGNFNATPVINSLSGWMKFIGILTIISGAITCFGIITAAIGVPMIFSGISLNKASKSVKDYAQYNSPNVLSEVFNYLQKYFKTQGILAIVGIGLSVLYLIVILVIIVLGAYSFMYNY